MDEMFVFVGILFVFCLGSCAGCAAGETDMKNDNQKKMIELILHITIRKPGSILKIVFPA